MSISHRRGQSSTVVERVAIGRLCRRSRVRLRLLRGCPQRGMFWWTTRPVRHTKGTGDTFDLPDGDLLIERIDYLCDWDGSADEQRWNDSLHRIFLDILHPEDGDLDHSTEEAASGIGGGVAGRVCVAEATSVPRTRRADGTVLHRSVKEWGGTRAETRDEVTSWARSRRHCGVVDGHVRAFGGIHHTTGRISRLPTTWVGQDSWGGRRV
jgi:hypothetical protein